MAVQIGPKIGIEGEKEYRQQIQQIIQQAKTLDSAMNKTSSEWDKNTSQLTKNKAKAENLQQSIQLMTNKLSIMNNMLEQSSAKFGENDQRTQAWQRAVNETTASINRMNNELHELNGAANLSSVSTQMADVGTKMQNMGQKLTSVGQRMTTAITLPIVAAGAASVKLASDAEEASNKVDVVFGSMADSVKNFANDALTSYGMASSTAMTMAGTFGAMASAMNLPQQESAKMAKALTGLAGDMASFYNVSQEVAATSLQGIFTGETEALKKFGIVMTQTNLEEFANKQGKAYSRMSEGEKVMLRYQYVMEATSDAQGDFARTSDGTANSLRVFSESLKELGASFGQALLPVITPIVQKLASLFQALSQMPEPIKKVVAVLLMIVAAVGPLILIVGTLMSSIGSIITTAPTIANAISSIIPVVLELAASFGSLIAAAAPWIALALLVAAAAYAVYSNWDSIKEAAKTLAEEIKYAYDDIITNNQDLINGFRDFGQSLINNIKNLPQKIADTLKRAAQSIKDAFKQMIDNAKQSGRDFIDGFANGVKERINKIIEAVKNVANIINEYLGFSCPDKGPLSKYESWMPDFLQGLAKGIKGNMYLVKDAMNDVAKTMSLPLSANAFMNMALSGTGGGYERTGFGDTIMNITVDHISELNDLLRIQNQAQQRLRMGAY